MIPCLVVLISKFLFAVSDLSGGEKKIQNREYNYDIPLNDVQSGYNYPVPNPPLFFDDSTTIHYPSYPLLPDPGHQYLPPQIPIYPPLGGFDPIPTDDTVVVYPPSNQYLPPLQAIIPLPPSTSYGVPTFNSINPSPIQVKILNMSCFDSKTTRFFRSAIHTTQPIDFPPVIEHAKSDCVSGFGDTFKIDLKGNQMSQCGIRYCSGIDRVNLCASVRIPTLKGLKLPEDYTINLQCKPQERIVSHTKHLKVSPQIIQGRSVSNVATGGYQNNFDIQVNLLRRAPGNNEFTQIVTPGSAVQLGEDLLLKAAVKDGDGWKYSRMGSVTMQRIIPTKASRANFDAITMVDNSGCRISSMKSVCPEHPRQVNPLITTLPFRAFMFQGANSGDEMVLSVKMLGCLQQEDCFQVRTCEDRTQLKTRVKRRTQIENDTITNWQSYLEFRVVLPESTESSSSTTTTLQTPSLGRRIATPVLLFVGLITVISLIVYLITLLVKRPTLKLNY